MSVFWTGKEGTELDDLWHEALAMNFSSFFWAKDKRCHVYYSKLLLSLLFALLILLFALLCLPDRKR